MSTSYVFLYSPAEQVEHVGGDLIPTSQSVVADNKNMLTVMGGVLIEIVARRFGRSRITLQFCYVCKEINRLYLSRGACEDLDGVFPWNKKISAEVGSTVTNVGTVDVMAECGCPVRLLRPPPPGALPFKENEVDKLEKWLLDR